MKLYIVLDKILDAGLKMAQGIHAAILFAHEHPELTHTWYTESNNIVVLEDSDIVTLADDLEAQGFAVSRFREPDQNNAVTAITAEPAAWKQLSTLPLAGASARE